MGFQSRELFPLGQIPFDFASPRCLQFNGTNNPLLRGAPELTHTEFCRNINEGDPLSLLEAPWETRVIFGRSLVTRWCTCGPKIKSIRGGAPQYNRETTKLFGGGRKNPRGGVQQPPRGGRFLQLGVKRERRRINTGRRREVPPPVGGRKKFVETENAGGTIKRHDRRRVLVSNKAASKKIIDATKRTQLPIAGVL